MTLIAVVLILNGIFLLSVKWLRKMPGTKTVGIGQLLTGLIMLFIIYFGG